MSGELLQVEALTRVYAMGGLFGRETFKAVDDVSLSISAERRRYSPSSANPAAARPRWHA